MINPTELRIGNWISIAEGIPNYRECHQVTSLWKDGMEISNGEYIGEYFPIPLTPEVLEKCGFG